MKRILWTVMIGVAVWALPRLSHPAVDVGKLDPVETVLLIADETGIRMKTDTGATGAGATLEKAWQDLYNGTGKNVFSDTTSKLILLGEMSPYWEEIYGFFRPSCLVCRAEEEIDLKMATEYLSRHRPALNLNRLRAGERNWETLRMKGGKGCLEPESPTDGMYTSGNIRTAGALCGGGVHDRVTDSGSGPAVDCSGRGRSATDHKG